MKRTGLLALSVVAVSLAGLVSCAGQEEGGPPEIRMGRDECAHCGMIIAEDRFSCASIVLDGKHQTPVLFDDIGDMLDYEHEHPDAAVKERYVHDHDSRAWRTAAACTYVWSETIETPMGSGLAAYADKAAADKRAAGVPNAKVMAFAELIQFRDQWRKDRRH